MKFSTSVRLGSMARACRARLVCAGHPATSPWTDLTAASRGLKIVVVGATPKAPVRRMYEDDFVAELEDPGHPGRRRATRSLPGKGGSTRPRPRPSCRRWAPTA